jgi:histidinol phosphatase-like PHP family hydrolase
VSRLSGEHLPEQFSRPALEIGYMLLLSDDSHAKRGLVEANWNSGHFRLASAGPLHFAPEPAVLIRQGLQR